MRERIGTRATPYIVDDLARSAGVQEVAGSLDCNLPTSSRNISQTSQLRQAVTASASPSLMNVLPAMSRRLQTAAPGRYKLFRNRIIAVLTSFARSCWVQCPHPRNMTVSRSCGMSVFRFAMTWSIPPNATTRSRSPAM